MKNAEIMNKVYQKSGIEEWLYKQRIRNKYEIREEKGFLVVDVMTDVDLNRYNLQSIGVQFGTVRGSFDISNNKLKNLNGCPQYVSSGFYCDSNDITSLVGGPEVVGSVYSCDSNKLENLKGAPLLIHDNFYASDNGLKSLEGCPVEIYGSLWLPENDIENLLFFPSIVKGEVHLTQNDRLGNLQKIRDFKELLDYHTNYVATLEQKKKLQEQIGLIKEPAQKNQLNKI